LQQELAALSADRTARAVVIAGSGRGFCAGHDMKEIHAHPDAAWQQKLFDDCAAMMQAIVALPQPVIARVHGVAAAAGCQLVSMCDLAIAVPEAKFALSGIHNGLFCSTPAVGVVRNVNRKRAMEMLVTGDLIDAATALSWALINRVVPAEALDDEVARFTDAIKAKSGAAIALGKEAFYRQVDMGLTEAYELAGRTMTCNLQDPDGIEGVDAFISKRKAKWRAT
jgi:enoyl-CoA hydratase/carnithine racemase